MFEFRQISWPGLIAAVAISLGVAAAFRLSDWGYLTVNRLILEPLMEVLRLAW